MAVGLWGNVRGTIYVNFYYNNNAELEATREIYLMKETTAIDLCIGLAKSVKGVGMAVWRVNG